MYSTETLVRITLDTKKKEKRNQPQ
uniref:Uncharacterized protein n=1 Tax=Anguilla anguilla TaxID=7936 RepID=A0A0E9RQ26_ANGAN